MIVNINGKEITLKKTMRSYIMFESITDKAFAPKNITDMITYFYCVIMSSEKGLDVSFDDFIDWVDDNELVMGEFNEWLYNISQVEADLAKKKTQKKKVVKK